MSLTILRIIYLFRAGGGVPVGGGYRRRGGAGGGAAHDPRDHQLVPRRPGTQFNRNIGLQKSHEF